MTLRCHVLMALVTAALALLFWRTRMEWDPEMRLWRAFGDTAVVLLFAALAFGPLARFSQGFARSLSWRRPVGVWAALAAFVHAFLTIDGWARWSLRRFLGFEFVPQLGREVRLEPGFGLANLLGAVAVVWLLVLFATSSDRAVRFLGPQAWKWVHNGAYVVFYLAVLHSGYFLFLHYTASFHRPPAPPNWFRWPLIVLGFGVLTLQWAAFAAGVRRRRARVAVRGRTR